MVASGAPESYQETAASNDTNAPVEGFSRQKLAADLPLRQVSQLAEDALRSIVLGSLLL
jgi:hypothetical protein